MLAFSVMVLMFCQTVGDFMFKDAALGFTGLCIMSSAAFANCSQGEMSRFQAAVVNYTNRAVQGDSLNAAALQAQLNALSPACQAYLKTQVPQPVPKPGPAPQWKPYGCVGGVCQTPGGDWKPIR